MSPAPRAGVKPPWVCPVHLSSVHSGLLLCLPEHALLVELLAHVAADPRVAVHSEGEHELQ